MVGLKKKKKKKMRWVAHMSSKKKMVLGNRVTCEGSKASQKESKNVKR